VLGINVSSCFGVLLDILKTKPLLVLLIKFFSHIDYTVLTPTELPIWLNNYSVNN